MRQSDVAYLRLREDIVSLSMRPGEPLPESATAARLGVSRTPVREAIRQLAQENLVIVIPERGAFVAPVSLDDVVELFQLRQALEPFSAQLASSNPDIEAIEMLLLQFEESRAAIAAGETGAYLRLCAFTDGEIARMTHNGRLQSMLASIWQQCRRIRASTKDNRTRLQATVDENLAILRAIATHDGEGAAALTRGHLSNSLQNILQSFSSQRD